MSDPTYTVEHMETARPRRAGVRQRGVPADIAAANDAYIASLCLPPLTAAQAARIRAIVEAAHEREQADSAAA